jgi:hypothetical protein
MRNKPMGEILWANDTSDHHDDPHDHENGQGNKTMRTDMVGTTRICNEGGM